MSKVGGVSNLFNKTVSFSIKNGFIIESGKKILIYYELGNVCLRKDKDTQKWSITDQISKSSLILKEGEYVLTDKGKLIYENEEIFSFKPKNFLDILTPGIYYGNTEGDK